ncbi:MAG: lysylphosphatidylglycerol synthase transmembrane domain-containing protein [Anaerolineales bacterium]
MRRNIQLLIGLAVSLLAFILAFRGANLAEVAGALRKANYFALIPGILLMWLGLYLRALSWRVILGGRVPYWRVFDALNEGYLLNNLLPFRLGELGRAYLISRHSHLTAWQALSSILVERIVDLVMAVAMLFAFLPLVAGLDWTRGAAVSAVALGAVGIVTLVLMARNGERLSHIAAGLLRRVPGQPLNPERWQQRIESFLAGLSVLRDPRRALQAAFWSGMAWVAAGLGAWAILRAFLPAATATMGFVTLTLVALGAAVPSAPGSAGVFELVIVQTLTVVFGVERNLALSYALVLHAANILMVTIMGAIALAREGETLTDLASKARGMLSKNQPADAPLSVPDAAAPKQ